MKCRKAVSAQLPMYKLIDLLYREARITDVTMKMLSDSKQQRLQSKASAHVQHKPHKLSVLWKQYRAGTRSVNGLLRACSRVYLSV